MPRRRRSPQNAPASRAKGLAQKFSLARNRTARGDAPVLRSGCRLSLRFCYCAQPALIALNLRSSRPSRVSSRACGGAITLTGICVRQNSVGTRSSRAKKSRASTEACSRWAATSGGRRRASRDRLVGEQLEDGGWNCEAPKSKRSSFHTTICVLEGLLEYERAVGSAPEIAAARRRGEEYLLKRALFRRLSTGEVANPAFLELAFPPRYHYDILRALDYFRAAGVEPDARMSDAVRVIESKRQADGRWLLDRAYDEALAVPFGESVGEPSRWNTLRALRVLKWYRKNPHSSQQKA